MNINDFLGIGVVGAVLSIAFQYFKGATVSGTTAKLYMVGLSIVVGGAYFLLRDTSAWQTILGVLAASSTVYALFLNNSSNQ